jgi:hypothetical protein
MQYGRWRWREVKVGSEKVEETRVRDVEKQRKKK